ncbi:LacI family DNA-binding transcriptional regulator [Hafnia alvei]|uniref:DNA-binding transcriptional regulator, LacI/PurR family n=1 Tax=Hafnia alvei TaxID=569 RepID=A0A1C6Z0G5_HAFAL|nr:LacI family DNA-binding transcriptional regulator [Hafnia alvei]NLS53277.1 LacI family DNA-binding transcriptional regulator [Hafnia alvei]SCM52501.1 DNA-binding transcriptional regulator, LacI/PurR family [Hafnia alvei]
MTKSVRVRDIAEAANVSLGAVSRALKGQPGLSEQTRERILSVARSLSYDFSRLRNDKIKRVLFILHRQHNTTSALNFYSPVLLAVENACREHEIALSFLALGPTDDVSQQVGLHAPDALLCAGFIEPEIVDVLQKMPLPLVIIDHCVPGISCINADNFSGGYQMTQHLLEQGYTRIAFLASSLAHYSIRQRERGYRQALYDAGVLVSPQYDIIAPPLIELEPSLVYALDDLLSLSPAPDAIFCYNDAAAMTVMSHCQQRGMKIPEDIAIAGFDNIDSAQRWNPPLSTMAIDKAALGKAAVAMLLNAPDEPQQQLLPVELKIRASTLTS